MVDYESTRSRGDTADRPDGADQLPPRGRKWLRNIRWLFPAVLLVAASVNYIDRTNLAIARPLIEGDLGLTPSEYGILLSAFFWPYAVANLPAGWLVDRLGPRRCITLSLVVWSLVTMSSALVVGFSSFIVVRVLLAIAEAPFYAAATKACTRWFPASERGRAIAVVNLGTPIGTGLAPPLVTLLMLSFGWRWMFVGVGLMGLLLAAIWLFVYRGEPWNHPWMNKEERELIRGGADPATVTGRDAADAPAVEPPSVSWGWLFKQPTMWAMVFAAIGIFYASNVYQTWMPAFLKDAKGLSVAQIGVIAAFPYLMGFLGMLTGGWWTDKLVKRGVSRIRARKIPIIAGSLLATATIAPAAIVADATVSVVFLGVGLFFTQMPLAIFWTLSTDVAPPGRVASVGTIQNGLGGVGSALAPVVTGYIVEATGYLPAFLVASALTLLAALIYIFFIREPMTPPALAAHPPV